VSLQRRKNRSSKRSVERATRWRVSCYLLLRITWNQTCYLAWKLSAHSGSCRQFFSFFAVDSFVSSLGIHLNQQLCDRNKVYKFFAWWLSVNLVLNISQKISVIVTFKIFECMLLAISFCKCDDILVVDTSESR
jgi:hypothetical protein